MQKTLTVLFTLLVITAPLFGAAPPDRMNFQGVLRNATDAPQNGTFDMVFEFYDAATLGNQILLDSHSGGGAVTVTGGLFNAQLGSGVVTDGTGPGTYTSLTNVMRDYSAVFVEVHVASETLTPRIQVASSGHALNAEHADLLDGLDSTAFATASHVHQLLTAGAGLGGVSYDGGTAKTFSVTYGTAASTAVQGNQTATITAGGGLTGSISADALGDGFSATLNVGAGNGISVAADTVSVTYGTSANTAVQGNQTATITAGSGLTGSISSDALGDGFSATVNVGGGSGISVLADTIELGPLTADWNQTGVFDIILSNASSRLKILESAGATFFGSLDVGDLSVDGTYTFSGNSGTVWTSGNDGTSSTLAAGDAGLLDGIDSTRFLRSDATDNYTQGTLTLDTGTTLAVNGTFQVGPASITDNDSIFFDDGVTEFLRWDDTNSRFALSDDVYVLDHLGVETAIQAGVVDVGGSAFNSFRSGTAEVPRGGEMTGTGDLYVQFDLEVGDDLDISDGATDLDVGKIQGFGTTALRIEAVSHPTDATSDPNLELYATGAIVEFALDKDNDEGGSGSFLWTADGLLITNRIMQLTEIGNLFIRGSLTENHAFDLAESFQMGEALEAGDLVRVSPNNPKLVLLTQGTGDRAVLGVVSAKPGVILGGGAFSEKELREAWGDLVADQYLAKREQLKVEILGKPNGLLERKKHLDSMSPASLSAIDEDGEDGKKQLQDQEMAAQYESDLEGESLKAFFGHHMAPVALSGRTPVKVDTQFGEIKIGDELGPSSIPGVAMKLTSAGPTIGTAMENFSGGRGMVLTFVHRGWYAPAVGAPVQTVPQDENEKSQVATQLAATNGNFPVILNRDVNDESALSISKDAKEGTSDDMFRVDEAMEVGDVVAADRTMPGIFRKTNTAHDPAVVGIVSAKRGSLTESLITEVDSQLASQFESARLRGDRKVAARVWEQLQAKFKHTHAPIAPSGRVAVCKVDAGYGGIEVGNLLVASPTSGHAMRSDNPLPGTVIGKALEPLASGTGLIRVLVMLR